MIDLIRTPAVIMAAFFANMITGQKHNLKKYFYLGLIVYAVNLFFTHIQAEGVCS